MASKILLGSILLATVASFIAIGCGAGDYSDGIRVGSVVSAGVVTLLGCVLAVRMK